MIIRNPAVVPFSSVEPVVALRAVACGVALLALGLSSHAQAPAQSLPAPAPVLPSLADLSVNPAADGLPGSNVLVTSPGAAARVDTGVAGVPPVVPRNQYIEAQLGIRAGVTDRAFLDPSPQRKEATVTVSPRLGFHRRGSQLRLNALVGFDSVTYVKDTASDYVQPIVHADVQAEVIDGLAFVDASADVDRRPASAYSAQSASVRSNEQLKTGVYRLTPRLEQRRNDWHAMLRSDNLWVRQSGDSVGTVTQQGNSYSQNTEARFERLPDRIGFGVEAGHRELRYEDTNEVIRLDNARAMLGYAFTPQLTAWALGGVERSRFYARTDTDSDVGMRLRWAPLERSVLTGEVRKRFFGTGYNLQWDHRNRLFGLSVGAAREPNTQPEAVQLAGNLGEQFDAIYRSRGYTVSQREALVRAALAAYGLPANLVDPVNVHVNRPQLSNTATAMVSFLGRRSVFAVSGYYRKLVALHRENDIAIPITAGDMRQVGGRASLNFRLTPLSSVEAGWQANDTRGLGTDAARSSREHLWSVGATHQLSPRARLNLTLQRQTLDTNDFGAPLSVAANSASLGLHYRF